MVLQNFGVIDGMAAIESQAFEEVLKLVIPFLEHNADELYSL